MFLLFQESDYHWKYHGRVSPLLGIECPGLDGLIQSIHDKTLPRNLVKIEPKNLPPSYQWKMSALRNRLIFCSPRSLVKVYSRKIPLITCRNEMKTVHSTVHTVVLCLPVVIDNIQGKLSLRLSGVSRESVVSGVFGETLRLTGGRPDVVWKTWAKYFWWGETDLAGSSLEEAADSSIEDDSWCSYLLWVLRWRVIMSRLQALYGQEGHL